MICVCIGRGRHKHVTAEHRHLVDQGAKLVELRLDYISGEVNLKRLLRDRAGPVIITCRREIDGGKWSGNEEDRQMLLRSAIAEGVEYVDLEDDVADKIPRFGATKRIVSMHDFTQTPENLDQWHARLAALDADVVKLSTMANNPHDNVRMLRLIARSDIPTVGMCMGEIGTPSRILAAKFGAAFTYATFHHERALAPGQLSFRQMNEIYHYEKIDADTDVYGVIADPIGHSLSPQIHNAVFWSRRMNKVYVPFRVPREHLAQFLADCKELGIKGLSVTIPHKEAVIKHLTRVDGAVRDIGAANTIVFKDGQTIGYNTDYRAAMNSLDQYLDSHVEKPLAGKTAILLGSGGVAKAIGVGLKRRGARVVVAGILPDQARDLAERLGGRAVPWEARHSIEPDVLVNGTPVGMHPNVDETPYSKHYLRPSMIVFDAVYNPEQTLLIKEARQRSCKTITGVEMFVRQAELQFELFTGEKPPENMMREQLKRVIGPVRYS